MTHTQKQIIFLWTNFSFIAHQMSVYVCVVFLFLLGRRFITLCAVTCIVKIIYCPCEAYKQDCIIIVTLISAPKDNAKEISESICKNSHIAAFILRSMHMANYKKKPEPCQIDRVNNKASAKETHTHIWIAWNGGKTKKQTSESIWILYLCS